MKKQLLVVPDYLSSGLWGETGEVSVEAYNISPMTKLALKYWHALWEQWDIDMPEIREGVPSKQWIHGFYKEWWEDGKRITCLIASFNPDLDVVHMADTPEEIMELYYGKPV